MSSAVNVPVETLRRAATILLQHLGDMEGPVITLDSDFYWSIPEEQRMNVFVEPTEFTIGQVSECLDNVGRIVDDPSLSTSFGLVWLADLLRAVGEAVVR